MSSKGSNGVMPKLRFSEFMQSKAWDLRSLGELFTDRQETGYNDLPLLSLTDKEGIIPQAASNRRDNSNLDKTKYLRVCPGDIAYNTMRMWEGRSALSALEGLVSPAYTVCKPTSQVHSPFFAYYFKTIQLISQFHRYSQGLVKDTLNLKYPAFSGIPVWVPSLPEQQKIADCLTSLDAVITAEAQKLDALKAHKKGLMQQLFPAEGETVPKRRFPEFRDSGEWVNATLGEIAKISSGGTPNRSTPAYWNGKIPWISTSLIDFATITETEEFITELGLQESAAKIFPKGTVIMAMYGQGKTRGKVAILGIEATTNQACAAILIKENIDSIFLFQNLSGRYEEIRKISNSGGQENLSATLIETIPFKYPDPLTKEQQRIADCLTSLDELIAAQAEKIEALRAQKKGLLQGLFPVAEAMAK